MRICYICVGGFEHIAPYLAYFKSAGHDVHFISLSPSSDYGVPTYNVGLWGKYSATEGKWKYPISMLRARRLVKKLKPDIVHAHYATSGGLAGLVCGFHPTIVTAHGTDLSLGYKSPVWRPLLKATFRHADCVNTCSEELKEKTISLGISAEKIVVLTPGVDTKKFGFVDRPMVGRDRPLRLVTTRQLDYLYDHATAVRALSIVKSRGIDFQMTFVAGGCLLEELKRHVEQEGLAGQVKFLGGVDKSEIPNILYNNDIFLSTPLWDAISVALLEAMASGLFPIVSDIKVNMAWLENGVGGFLYRVGDSKALADCILKVYDDPEFLIRATKRNRKKVVESGDTGTNMKRLCALYQKLIEKRR